MTVVQFGAGGPSTDFGQFGSKTAGSPQTSQLPAVIMQLDAWDNGWQDAAVGAAFNPYLEDMNGFCLVAMYFIANAFERGIPDWDSGTTYYKGAVVQAADGSGQYFYSLTDNNLANALPVSASNAQWQWLNAPQVPVGAVMDYAGITAPDNYAFAVGTALVRADYASLVAAITITRAGTLSGGSAIVTGLSTTADLKAGWPLSGTGVATGAKIQSIDSSSQITMTAVATGGGTQSLFFAPFGVGNGTTTFNLPDYSRRVGVGNGGSGSATLAAVLGATGGEEAHTMLLTELVAHHHQFAQPNVDPSAFAGGGNDGRRTPTTLTDTTDTGGGTPFNVMQPSIVVNKIIRVR